MDEQNQEQSKDAVAGRESLIGGSYDGNNAPKNDDFVSTLPEEYREKPYMKGIDSMDKLLSKFDGAQKLIGKKPFGIPEESAPKEDWEKLYNSLGRPESPDKYLFEENLPEGIKKNEAFENEARTLMHEIGLSQKQAQALKQWFDGQSVKAHESISETNARLDSEFNDLADKTFGDKKDHVLATAKKLLGENSPKEFAEDIGALGNKELIILAGVLNNIQQKYIKQDSLPENKVNIASQMSDAEKRAERLRLMALPGYSSKVHPEHESIHKKLGELGGINYLQR